MVQITIIILNDKKSPVFLAYGAAAPYANNIIIIIIIVITVCQSYDYTLRKPVWDWVFSYWKIWERVCRLKFLEFNS